MRLPPLRGRSVRGASHRGAARAAVPGPRRGSRRPPRRAAVAFRGLRAGVAFRGLRATVAVRGLRTTVAAGGVVVAATAGALGGCGGAGDPGASLARTASGPRAQPRPASVAHDPMAARIVHVVDGDTVDARLDDGAIQRVRLIGIDTPEKYTTRTGYAECGGEEASRATRAIAAGWLDVRLVPDRTQDAYDTYGRLLAYVVPDAAAETTYQEAILRAGWAKVYVYRRHPFTRVAAFRRAAGQARDADRGVWRACGGDFRRPRN